MWPPLLTAAASAAVVQLAAEPLPTTVLVAGNAQASGAAQTAALTGDEDVAALLALELELTLLLELALALERELALLAEP